ncbi:class I adenylate-forming enzyme family protein [Phaeobacter sp.]|uniref:class I adenylate-forming enzyme family protein n=1 Tax=Phaeobacter sp. TaxID=1902409 RepID=UPI0025E5A3D6|nr:class I adenylate-forming enzyme family protein [Phaeobacter sp.]
MISLFDTGAHPPCPDPFNLAEYVLYQGAAKALAMTVPRTGPETGEETGQTTATAPDSKVAVQQIGTKQAGTTQNGLAEPDTTLTYGALRQAVRATGTGLRQAGVTAGDRVLLRLGNTVDFPIAYLGAIAIGALPVPTSAQLTEPEVQRIFDELAPVAVLCADDVPCPPHPRQIPLEQLRAMRDLPPCDFKHANPDRPAYLVYTSGTSGRPRAVVHAHRAIWARQMMIRDWYDLRPTDRLLHAGAFNWTFTLGTGLMDPWSVGATAVIPQAGLNPAHLPDCLSASEATLFAAAPGVYRKALQATQWPDLPHLRHGLSAGEKLSETLAQRWRDITNCAIYEAFGMSECSTFLSARPGRMVTAGALGWPQQGRRVAILDADGAPTPAGTAGTIAVAATDPGLMLGYFDAKTSAPTPIATDWFVSGDRGQMAEDGQITYLGREDDMMNAGGFRVSPQEVERVLQGCPGLQSIAVAQVEIKEDTRIIVAFFTADDDHTAGPDGEDVTKGRLADFANANLARYKQPRAYLRVPALPTGPNGKLLRRALPALFLSSSQRTPT